MKPNEYGVYPDCERIFLPAPKGCKAEIRLAEDTDGWRSSYQFVGKMEGCGSFPFAKGTPMSREEAIAKAKADLVKRYPVMSKYVKDKEVSLF